MRRNSSVALVEFSHTDRYKAQMVTRELMTSLVGSVPELKTLDPPNLPERPDGPNRAAIAGYGLLAGLFLGTTVQSQRKRNLMPQPA